MGGNNHDNFINSSIVNVVLSTYEWSDVRDIGSSMYDLL